LNDFGKLAHAWKLILAVDKGVIYDNSQQCENDSIEILETGVADKRCND